MTAFCPGGQGAVFCCAGSKKTVSVGSYVLLREMADAGNFGGSVPECKRNTVLSPSLSGDCLFFL
ncbi:TPA_asm: hypothetical protein GND03_004228 [Salmonella enterica subsp. houtenae serovar 16:z4,z32:-]|uniref:Uncharacterized protein n=1 Tax=Salmonella enterica subsp. houtenae serovar 16:z4,z32:- TaxID=1307497 RepID=A0A735L3M2_SALHO|nr:hypothetical protein [Salmonella enterica]EDQ6566082.1 hypothetical protein [Salmonella enterica subsp. houtenae]EDS7539616.1 hypothetical protein [Salmonella enterica subsp. enterica]EGI6410058.1 hypothetical protein [Salmonella enterica subsp. houtenae serovar 16:z4,z32:-]EAP8043348.1 hypothetical protein [Salmonella enterica]